MEDKRPDWLKNWADKTWNMELIVSGAATYFTSNLPKLVEDSFHYYLINLNEDISFKSNMMPMLVYTLLKLVAWLLPIAFAVHFVFRAFWVGLIGLHTSYPKGIQYNQLHGIKKESSQLYEKHFGTLSDYIQRIDRTANVIFALAFNIVLYGLGIGVVYLIMFYAEKIIPWCFGHESSVQAHKIALYFFCGLTLIMLVAQRVHHKIDIEKYPKLVDALERYMLFFPNLIMPLIYRPIAYLNYTFSSNTTKKTYYGNMIIVLLLFFLFLFFSLFTTMRKIRFKEESVMGQDYFGHGTSEHHIFSHNYADQLGENDRPGLVVLPSQIAEGPFLPVFTTYTNWMDKSLNQIYPEVTVPDSLPRVRRYAIADSIRIGYFNQQIKLFVDDSMIAGVDWYFAKLPADGRLGITTMLSTKALKPGKNMIKIGFPSPLRIDSMMLIDKVPVWKTE